jgi:hypothetical protein
MTYKVALLVWELYSVDCYVTDTVAGEFRLLDLGGKRWNFSVNGRGLNTINGDLEQAKQVVQAYFEGLLKRHLQEVRG